MVPSLVNLRQCGIDVCKKLELGLVWFLPQKNSAESADYVQNLLVLAWTLPTAKRNKRQFRTVKFAGIIQQIE